MPNGVDVGDAGPSLQQASAEAQQSLSDAGGASPVSQFAPAPPLQHSGPKQPARRSAIPAGPNPNETVAPDQGAGIDTGVHPDFNAPAPPKPSDTAVNDPSFMNFLKDTFKGTGAELKDVIPRTVLSFGSFLSKAGPGLVGETGQSDEGGAKLLTQYIDKAVKDWTPDRAAQTGEGTGSGGAAQAIGGGLEAVPYMVAGPVGAAALVGKAGYEGTEGELQQGHDVATAVANGTVDAVTSFLQMKLGVIPSLPLLKRIFTAIPLGDLMKMAGDYTKKLILHHNGYADDAAKINVLDDLGEATVQNAIFGALPGHAKEKAKVNAGGDQSAPVTGGSASGPVPSGDTSGKTTPPAPLASAVPPPAAVASPATAQPPVAPASAVGTAAPRPIAAVPDAPTPEPAKNLRAQFNDLRNKDTPRTGVFVPKDNHATLAGSKDANAAAVTNQINQAGKQGRTIELPQGTLVLKTVALKKTAEADLKAGKDPQDIIGLHTGAGAGKSPDQTAVVQGTTPSGAVATETAVHPADVPLAVAKVEDQGKTPVVTTPEAAIKARMAGISTERNTPTEMGIMTHPDGREIAVHVEPGAPEGHLRIRAIDAEGEPSDHHVDVPAERVKLSKPKEAAATSTKVPYEEPKAAEAALPEPPKPTETVAPKEVAATEAPVEEIPAVEATPAEKPAGNEETSQPTVTHTPKGEPPAERGEVAESAPPSVAAAPAKTLKAVKPKSALESLSTSLETHEQQEAIPEGKKFAASLTERQDNASAFAAVLKAAAESARGKAGVSDIERALGAAKAAERLTEKGQVATKKGQGTGHVRVSALVNEMHKAARGLLGDSHEGDAEKVAPKAAELKAKIEKVKTKLTAKPKAKPPAKPKEDLIEVPVNPKYAGDIRQPKKAAAAPEPVVDKDLARKAQRLSDHYIWAENGDDAKAARLEVEKFLHENFPEHKDNALQLLDTRRTDENPDSVREKRMSETIDDEESMLDPTDKYEGMQKGGRELLNAKLQAVKDKNTDNRLATEWNSLAKNAEDNGVLRGLKTRVDSGDHVGSHDLLNRLIGSADTPLLRAMLTSLRAKVPDMPVYMVSKIKNLKTGAENNGAAGLFSSTHEAIQGTFEGSPARTLQNLVHEMRHAATAYELRQNPKGELAQASASARAILVKRLAARYGLDNVLAHMDFFEGKGPKPEDYKGQLYGIHSILEMHAELDNPKFVREIIESEQHAQPGENIPKSTGGLLGRIYALISKFFGVDNPRLLRHIAELHESTMDAQHANPENSLLNQRTAASRAEALGHDLEQRLGANPLEARKAAEPLMNLRDEEPPKLRGVDEELSNIAGEDTTKIARTFKHAVNSRAIDAVRTVVTRLKSVDQIFRDHRSDFGHPDDANNALSKLEDVQTTKNILMHKMHEVTRPVSEAWLKLPEDVNIKLGQLMGDTTSYKIDPRKELKDQIAEVNDDKKAAARHAEFVARYRALPADARWVYGAAIDANKRLARETRKAGIDAALHTFTDTDITPAQRSLLYGAKTHEVYDQLIGEGKLIDVGARNNSLREVLASFASQQETAEPYLHLGRDGDYVVHAKPEGTKEFDTRSEAEAFAERVGTLSPNSKATYAERGGKHVVDYKADYTSFHKDKNSAEAARDEMTKFGLDVGNVTQKTLGKENTPITGAARELVAEAERKINKMGDGKADEGSQALVDSLRSALLQALAARSAYAGSKLARKASAGWKPEEMRKNFADYASSTIWHAAQMRTVFDQASALARVRGMARDPHDADQKTTYRRGQVVAALNDHMQDEVQNFGHKSRFNSALAKLGFMSYLASPSHAFIWMTQNFTTGIPVAGARWGYGRATSSFMSAMKVVSGPAFRATIHNAMERGGNASAVHDAIVAAVKADPRFGKWAKGENSHFQQLIDRGVINHSYSNELGALARGDSAAIARAFEWARLLPNMADAFNRVSTALAGLEMTGGDLRKTADFVREIHADYSSANKPLLFKKLNRVPGGNSVTMFKTYVQAMAHLLYGNLKASMSGDKKFESAKTVAGLMVGTSLFAGVFAGAAIEPLRLAVYAYHKLFDDEGDAYDLKNTVHHWLVDAMGKTGGNLAAYGLPHALGFDLSSRMGLANLFFHDPPDLLSASKDNWKNFLYGESGTMTSLLAGNVTNFMGHMQKGEPFQAISSIIPIKQWQDAVKAYQLATTGKLNSLGGQMTQPSLGDAAWQLAGLKPASVAEAQEKSSAVVDFKSEVKSTRDAIMKDYVSSKDKARATVRLNTFNKNHPAEAIMGKDLRGLMKAREMAQQGVSRDPEVTKRTNF